MTTALITGASSGIGRDLARRFARDRHDVVLVARSEAPLRELAAELEGAHGITAHVIVADLAKPEAPAAIVEELRARSLDVDVLVNNAGYGLAGAFVGTDWQTELGMIQVNVVALTHLTKLLLPAMVARKAGRILNVASTAAFQPGPLMAVYYATKAFVLSFSEAIAEELRDSGVTVTTLCPGPTATGFASSAGLSPSHLVSMASAEVAEIGYTAMQHGKRVVVTGTANKVLAQAVRFMPRRLVTKLARRMQENR